MDTHEPVRVAQAWQEAANTQNVEWLLAVSAPDIEIVGPRGSGYGYHLLKEWLARAGHTLCEARSTIG